MNGADPRAIRVVVSPGSRHDDDPAIVVGPGEAGDGPSPRYTVDGAPVPAHYMRLDARHAALDGIRILFGEVHRRPTDGVAVREVVVDGWRVEVELEAESQASLRERARRAGAGTVAGGPAEVRAIIPGRIVAVSVGAGDAVTAGQQLLVLEAMKMQNELRAPRDGVIERVAVAEGQTVEVGDVLLVIR